MSLLRRAGFPTNNPGISGARLRRARILGSRKRSYSIINTNTSVAANMRAGCERTSLPTGHPALVRCAGIWARAISTSDRMLAEKAGSARVLDDFLKIAGESLGQSFGDFARSARSGIIDHKNSGSRDLESPRNKQEPT
jgi:hypothetical protein